MQAVVKKVVYSFRYRLAPGQVGREVFHIVLRRYETLWNAKEIASVTLRVERERHTDNVFHIILRDHSTLDPRKKSIFAIFL